MEQERQCAVLGCPNTLAACVPEEITWCSEHQLFYREAQKTLRTSPSRKHDLFHLMSKVSFFFRELTIILRIGRNTLYEWKKRNKIQVMTTSKGYLVRQEELLRLLVLLRTHMSLNAVASLLKVNPGVLNLRIEKGLIMPTAPLIKGKTIGKGFERRELPSIRRVIMITKGRLPRNPRGTRLHLKQGELSTREAAKLVGLKTSGLIVHFRKKHFIGYVRGGCLCIPEKGLQRFVIRCLSGEIQIKPATARRMEQYRQSFKPKCSSRFVSILTLQDGGIPKSTIQFWIRQGWLKLVQKRPNLPGYISKEWFAQFVHAVSDGSIPMYALSRQRVIELARRLEIASTGI